MPTEKPRKRALLVVGMHRSGTSAMARVLSLAGAALPKDVMPATAANEKGHWEPSQVAYFNDRLLAKLDTSWDGIFAPRRNRRSSLGVERFRDEARSIVRDQYRDEQLIVLKEPRVTLLIDFWKEILEAEDYDCRFVIMVRQPEEVAASLRARDKIERTHALLLWCTYMTQADLLTRDAVRIFCSYDDLIRDPISVLDRIEEQLGLDLPRRTAKSETEIIDFVAPELRHQRIVNLPKLPPELSNVTTLSDHYFDIVRGLSPNDDAAAAAVKWLRSLDTITSPLLLSSVRKAKAENAAHSEDLASLEQRSREASEEAAREMARRQQLESELAENLALAERRRLEEEEYRRLADEKARAVANLEAALREEIARREELNAALEAARASLDLEKAGRTELQKWAEDSSKHALSLEATLKFEQEQEAELRRLAAEKAKEAAALETALRSETSRREEIEAALDESKAAIEEANSNATKLNNLIEINVGRSTALEHTLSAETFRRKQIETALRDAESKSAIEAAEWGEVAAAHGYQLLALETAHKKERDAIEVDLRRFRGLSQRLEKEVSELKSNSHIVRQQQKYTKKQLEAREVELQFALARETRAKTALDQSKTASAKRELDLQSDNLMQAEKLEIAERLLSEQSASRERLQALRQELEERLISTNALLSAREVELQFALAREARALLAAAENETQASASRAALQAETKLRAELEAALMAATKFAEAEKCNLTKLSLRLQETEERAAALQVQLEADRTRLTAEMKTAVSRSEALSAEVRVLVTREEGLKNGIVRALAGAIQLNENREISPLDLEALVVAEMDRNRAEVAALQSRVQELLNSKSWYVTKPFRYAVRRVHEMVRRLRKPRGDV